MVQLTIKPNPRMNQDKRIEIAFRIYERFPSGHFLIHKTTRAGATTALLAESMNREENFLCVVPTNEIAIKTVIEDSKRYSDLDNVEVIRIPANHECLINKQLCEEFPDLRKLPILPLGGSCSSCSHFHICEVTAIVRKPQAKGIVLTNKKLSALLLASNSRLNTYAERVLKVLEKSKNLILDEVHEIQFGDVTTITVYDDKVFSRVNLDKYISINPDFPYLRRVITQFSFITKDMKIQNAIHEVLGGAQDEHFSKNHLNKSLRNPSTGITEGENETKVIVGAYDEIIELTKTREKYNLEMNDILDLYSMISIVVSETISVNGIRDHGIIKINLSAVDQTTVKMIQSFTMSMQSKNRRILLTSATICSYDYGQLFMGGVKPKKISFGTGGDPMNSNSKMLILADSKRYHVIGRNSLYNQIEEIVLKIINILELYGDSDCIIITLNKKESIKLQIALENAGHPHEVTYYKAPKMMGVSANERVMIAVGIANKPSNSFDVITTNTEESKVMLWESIHCDTWQAWSRIKDPSGKVPSLVFALGCTVEECKGITTWGYNRKLKIEPYVERQKKEINVTCENGIISSPIIKKCKNFKEMLIEASLHKLSKNPRKKTENLLIYYNIRRFCKKKSQILHCCKDLVKLVFNRTDAYAIQNNDGTYIKVPIRVSDDVIKKHLEGILTLGAYQLNLKNEVKWICFDIDSHAPKNVIETEDDIKKRDEKAEYNMIRMCNFLNNADIPYLLEKSGSPHSYHIWIFLEPVSGKKAKYFASLIKKEAGIDCEVFPKQGKIRSDEYGNLVKVPLATHRKHHTKSSIFVNGEFVSDFTDLEVGILDISKIEIPEEKKAKKPKVETRKHVVRVNGHVKSGIRPCIEAALGLQLISDSGNFMRVAICREYYNSGIHDPEKLIDLFRSQADFSYEKTKYHVRKVIEKPLHNVKCETLNEKGSKFVNCEGCKLFFHNSYFLNQVTEESPML